jgi:phage tail-like protein
MPAERYQVKIEGFRSADFDEIEGLSGAIEVVAFQDGDDLVLRKRPGRVSFGDITLRRGRLDAVDFYRWWYAARSGKVERRGVDIAFLDGRGRALLQWHLEAWPVSWSVSARGAEGKLVALESFTLAVEAAELVG